jgi:hypothetical protein
MDPYVVSTANFMSELIQFCSKLTNSLFIRTRHSGCNVLLILFAIVTKYSVSFQMRRIIKIMYTTELSVDVSY